MYEISSLKAKTLAERARDGIRGYIINNGIEPGAALPSEAEFAQRFEVSRNVVREAVKSLESMGLLEVRRGNGIFVKQFSFAPLLANLPYGLLTHHRPLTELLELRELLEIALIERVVRDHTAADLEPVDAALAAMREKAHRLERFQEEDRAFHQSLFAIAGNRMVLELIDVFWVAFDESSTRLNLPSHDPAGTYQLHQDIADAVRAHDAEAARTMLRRHYEEVEARLQTAIEVEEAETAD